MHTDGVCKLQPLHVELCKQHCFMSVPSGLLQQSQPDPLAAWRVWNLTKCFSCCHLYLWCFTPHAVLADVWRQLMQSRQAAAPEEAGTRAPAPVDKNGVELRVGDKVKLYVPTQQVAAVAVVKVVGEGALLMEDKEYKVGWQLSCHDN